MQKDPYRNSAYIYDFFFGPPNSWQKRLRLQMAPVEPEMRVLDVGCGTGSDLQVYARAGCRVHGIDVSPTMLKMARKRLGKPADLRRHSAVDLPYRNDSFDLVLASYALHEMPCSDRLPVLAEMTRVVKPSGGILLTDFRSGPHDFPMGWIDSAVIYLYERMAGVEHFRNGRDFLRRGGLEGLVARTSLSIETRIFPKGRAIALYLLIK